MKAYLITGESGTYDDWRIWNVAVSFDKELVNQFRDQLNEFLSDNNISKDIYDTCYFEDDKIPNNPEDRGLKENWNNRGIEYKIKAVKVLDKELQ